MNGYVALGLGLAISIGVVAFYHQSFIKTLILIAKVSPYEQVGTGAGKILIIGDSTGYGTGANESNESVAGLIGQRYPGYSIENDSENGRKIESAIVAAAELEESYDLIVLQIGGNDLLAKTPVSQVVAELEVLVSVAMRQADHVVILTAGNIGAVNRFTGETALFYENLSRDYTEAMIEFTQPLQQVYFVPLFVEPAEDPFVKQPTVYTANDELHPTSQGYRVWFEKTLPVLDTIL